MNERPPQPPEGKLIADAAAARGLSIREAARRTGISYGRWRQIVTGVQNISPGVTAPVRAPAATVARMARVAGVTPDELEAEGRRADAAAALRAMITRDAAVRSAPGVNGGTPEDSALRDILDDARLPLETRRAIVALAHAMKNSRANGEESA